MISSRLCLALGVVALVVDVGLGAAAWGAPVGRSAAVRRVAAVRRGPRRVRRGPRSVEVHRGPIRVYTRPMLGSPWRGFIVAGGRFPVLATRPRSARCGGRWFQIGPEAWTCSGWMLPRGAPPTARRQLQNTWQPGPYVGRRTGRWQRVGFFPSLRALSRGRVRRLRGDLGFQVHSRLLLMRRVYLRTRSGGYVDEGDVRPYAPTALVGLSLSRLRQLPVVVALRDTPLLERRGKALVPTGRTLRRYAVRAAKRRRGAPVLVIESGAEHVVLGSGHRVRRADVALAVRPPAPPAGVTARTRWVDVDAAERVVYAMQGPRPVRVMLTSLGPNTPRGTFRVEQKILHKDMQHRGGATPYYLEAVPYVVFFKGDFALHGAYWHDTFGSRTSHGCLNLSLVDARFVFGWLQPALRPGFLAIYPTARDPGGVVRVRRRYVRRPWEPAPPKRRRRTR